MKEIVFRQAVATLRPRRLWNAAKVASSFLVSAVTGRSYLWGLPPILTIEPTNVCNLKCPLCVTGNGRLTRSPGRMTFDTFKHLIDEIGDYVFYLLLYHQGEPYINRDFLRFVEYAKKKRIYCTTSTNGHYLDPENAARTVASGLDTMIVSIDGADQRTYEKYRVAGELQRVQEGIRNLVAAKTRQRSRTPYIFLQFLVMRHNEEQIPEMEKMAAELGVDKLLKKNVQVETVEEAAVWLPREEKYRRYDYDGRRFTVKRGGKGPCPRPWLTTLVNWDGTVVPCCFDKNAHHAFGKISGEVSYPSIWKNGQHSKFQNKMLRARDSIDICENCNQGLGIWI
jgi:radical SAM protein with 4Fe4S-binding SPASM domain